MIPVPLATEYTVRVTGAFHFDFRCPRCGGEARAKVRAMSKGTATGGPLAIFALGRIARAEAKAVEGLPKEGRALLDLAKCPSCCQRNPEALRTWWIVHVVQALFVLGIFVGVPSAFLGVPFEASPWIVAAAVALGVTVNLWVSVRLRLKHVDERVAFVRDVDGGV